MFVRFAVKVNRHPTDALNREVDARRNEPGKLATGEEAKNNPDLSLLFLSLSFTFSFFHSLSSQVVRGLDVQRRSEGRRDSASHHSEADERIQQVPQAFL